MLSDEVREIGNQLAVLPLTFWFETTVSVITVAYCANVLFAVFLLAPSEVKTVHGCNLCLLHMTLRVACSLSLYGVLTLFNREAVLAS